MNRSLKAILLTLLNKRCIGAKHTPEEKIVTTKTKYLTKQEKKEFEKEYKQIVNQELVLRHKKRTGKGSDYHICLNPRKIKIIMEKIQ